MLKLFGKIVNGKFVFSTPDHKEKQLDFAKKHHGLDFEINIIQIKRAEYYNHKWLRGPLLLSIADYHDNSNIEKVYFDIKKRFLFYPVENNDISTIPDSHKKGIVFLADDENIKGYVRGTSSLDNDEFIELNKKVEIYLFDELNYRIIESQQKDAQTLKSAMKSKLFGEEVECGNFDEMSAF